MCVCIYVKEREVKKAKTERKNKFDLNRNFCFCSFPHFMNFKYERNFRKENFLIKF